MGGNNEFFENFERNKYLKKLPSMQRVKLIHQSDYCSLQHLHLSKLTFFIAMVTRVINALLFTMLLGVLFAYSNSSRI